ncbi:MAG: MerR family transcriptional regulator [Acetobacteraceae bacterium]|nr:MerR family transcriptional regulator [Acetobacteraceae bacterium]
MQETERVQVDQGRTLPNRIRPIKAPSAFRTISEVADQLHIPQHVLRFWETKFQQVKPLKRGGGRRYYRPGDIGLLQRISDMLYIQGYTIKGVQRLLREGSGKLIDVPPIPPQYASQSRVKPDAPALGVATPDTIFQDGTAQDSSAHGMERAMNLMMVAEPELPLLGLTRAARPASTSVRQAKARAQQAEDEVQRLRALLEEVLGELETLRGVLV